MALPPPPRKQKLEAATSRFAYQLERTRRYIDVVLPTLKSAPEHDADLQYFFETIVLMLHTFIEEYFRLLIGMATVYHGDEVRTHLASRNPDQAVSIEEMTIAQLMHRAQDEVSFRGEGKKIKAIFAVLFDVGPFADSDAEAKCLDLVRIRNAITHQGGSVDESYATQLSSPDAAIEKTVSGSLVTYKLRIQPKFFGDVLIALSRSLVAIDESLKTDPRYSI